MKAKERMKNPRENFSGGEAGESRDNVAERLDWARRLEQVERLKAEERMKNPKENFPGGEAGITPRMREQTSRKIFLEVSLSLFQNSPLTHQDGPGRAEIHRG